MSAIPPTAALILGALKGVQAILESINEDNPKRERFTQDFVNKAREEFPDYNVVIIHPEHKREGVWIHQHYELPISFGRTIGYEVYFSKKGDSFTLENLGDGGFINWAYNGYGREGMRIFS
jgi:hypothetical protein